MKKRLISLTLSLITLMSLLAVPASAASSVGAVTTSDLNLRKSGSTSATVITVMPKNAQLIVLSTSKGWSKVVYNDTIGYASADYLKSKTTVSGKFGTGTISGSDVRMRKDAGTSYSILGTYAKGTKMTVIGAKNEWYKVSYNGKTGYVRSDYMTISAPAAKTSTKSSSSSTSTTTTSSTSTTTYTGVIKGDDVRMRKGAGTSYTILGTYSNGTKMTVTGSKDGWYKVKYDGKSGYVCGDYMRITPKTKYSTAKSGTVSSSVNLRMGPSSDKFSIICKQSSGTKVKVTGLYGSWYEVTVDGKYGYISKSYIKLTESKTESGVVTGDDVRLRSGPGTSYSTLGYYNAGTKLTVNGKSGDWYSVTINGVSGYMHSDYVKLDSTPVTPEKEKTVGDKLVEKAKQYLGVPYVYGGASPNGFDCSGLMYYVYSQFGYTLKRGATGQYLNNGKSVSKSKLQTGDLLFFNDSTGSIGHVGMYVGNGQFIHASSSKGKVVIADLYTDYYDGVYAGARRIV